MNVFPLAVVMGAYLLIRGGAKVDAVKKLNYALEGLPKPSFSGGTASVTFKVLISNPSPESFTVTRAAADIFIGTTFVGNAETTAGFFLGAYGRAIPELLLRVSVSNAALSLIRAIAEKGSGLYLRFSGAVIIPGGTIPMDFTQKL